MTHRSTLGQLGTIDGRIGTASGGSDDSDTDAGITSPTGTETTMSGDSVALGGHGCRHRRLGGKAHGSIITGYLAGALLPVLTTAWKRHVAPPHPIEYRGQVVPLEFTASAGALRMEGHDGLPHTKPLLTNGGGNLRSGAGVE
ncbi:hypothetical protein BH683_010345 [Williamsia sp. 1138]|uniref:hypothetical protein n=1 Tax=Williamsia sp. 1138 TaxID=1903117 RepID=UPI000A1123FF|nr:hypothetical protein [Williamsia sp. 1138]OZG29299.1 hypothetical protein BH683_010345 [Williamsia sp. 1138]